MEYFLEKKICIVGSGFCGYTAYKKLANDDSDLLVVEGGKVNTPSSPEEQEFYKLINNPFVSSIKIKNKISEIANLLDASFGDRKYTLGGSSECWTGWIKPLEKTTYQNSFSEMPTQKWGGLDLTKYNQESLKILNSPILNFDPYEVAKSLNIDLPELPKGLYYTVYAWANSPIRFKKFWTDKLNSDPNKVTSSKNVLCNFKLVDALVNGDKIEKLIFSSNEDKLVVKAEVFILGLGGIENARFIERLQKKNGSNIKEVKSLGNFQEHPHIYEIAGFNLGKYEIPRIFKERIPYYSEGKVVGKVKFAIAAWDGFGSPKVAFEIKSKPKNWKGYVKSILKGDAYLDYDVHMRCEQTPNLKSKLRFDGTHNKLDWRVIDSDFKFYSEYLKRFISFLKYKDMIEDFSLGIEANNGFAFPKSVYGGAHHMGTVPYAKEGGEVDENFRHLEYKNMYIVGSSAFPTSGFENPTHAAISTTLAAVDDIKKTFY